MSIPKNKQEAIAILLKMTEGSYTNIVAEIKKQVGLENLNTALESVVIQNKQDLNRVGVSHIAIREMITNGYSEDQWGQIERKYKSSAVDKSPGFFAVPVNENSPLYKELGSNIMLLTDEQPKSGCFLLY